MKCKFYCLLLFHLLLLSGLASCTYLFYQPTRIEYVDPKTLDEEAFIYEDFYFPSADGTLLHGWKIPSDIEGDFPRGVVLFFHGNAENLTSHFIQVSWLAKAGYDVVLVDYRGYGRSAGTPTPRGVYEDSLAALEWVVDTARKERRSRIILYGQSLGGIVAMRAMQDSRLADQVDLLVLDSTFASYQDVAFAKLKDSAVTFLLSPLAYLLVSDAYAPDRFFNQSVKAPILVIHGTSDRVVPFELGRDLYAQLPGRKTFWAVEGAQHLQTLFVQDYAYREKLLQFFNEPKSE